MKKLKIIGKILSPIMSEVLRVKKWKILHFLIVAAVILRLPFALSRITKSTKTT